MVGCCAGGRDGVSLWIRGALIEWTWRIEADLGFCRFNFTGWRRGCDEGWLIPGFYLLSLLPHFSHERIELRFSFQMLFLETCNVKLHPFLCAVIGNSNVGCLDFKKRGKSICN